MFTRICKVSEIRDDELYRFDVKDKALLVVQFQGSYFVTDSTCTHEEADLSLGMFSDGVVTCPLHRARFKVESGDVVSGPDGGSDTEIPKLKAYTTRVEDGELWADLE
ncbi:MAG TPA: Rieske 2Fe-2S domain-containing protein [Nitrososphaerales archaeon]|nr:Rieske 2Fe-2S domain-containing protein [Nitrososphaerales archaeon]